MFNYEQLLKIKDEILTAREGMETNHYFEMALDNLVVMVNNITRLKEEIDEVGMLTTKVYVKGRENIELNPALKEIRMQVNDANKAILTIYEILKQEKELFGKTETDPLMEIIKGK